jgi:hypothetical protein
VNKEHITISSMDPEDCSDIVKLNENDIFAFSFKNNLCVGKISEIQSINSFSYSLGKQISCLKYLQDLHCFVFISHFENNGMNNMTSSFEIIDEHYNNLNSFLCENPFEEFITFAKLDISSCDSKLFAVGTYFLENSKYKGFIYILNLIENMKIIKIAEVCCEDGINIILSKSNLLYVASNNKISVYSIKIFERDENDHYQQETKIDIKLLRIHSDFTLIDNIYLDEDYLIVCDRYKSLAVFMFNSSKEKFEECFRESSTSLINCMTSFGSGIILCGDEDSSLICMRREYTSNKKEDEKFKYNIFFNLRLQIISQINIGEKITALCNVKQYINNQLMKYFISDNDSGRCCVNFAYYGTLEGTLGVVIPLSKHTYEYLLSIQNEIMKMKIGISTENYRLSRACNVNIFMKSNRMDLKLKNQKGL